MSHGKQKKTKYFPSPFTNLSLISSLLILLSSSWSLQGIRNGECSQSITAPLCFSFLLTLFSSCSAGSPWAAVLQEKYICSIVGSHICYRSCQEKSAVAQAFHWLQYVLCHGAFSFSWSLLFVFSLPHLQAKIFPFTAIKIVKNYLVLLSSLVKMTMTPYLSQIYALLMPKPFISVHKLMCHLSDI